MNAVPQPVRLLVGLVLGLVVVACGPTATAIRPTLPPRSAPPGAILGPDATAGGAGQPPTTSATPQPPGIGTAMASFPQGGAYEVDAVTATSSGYMAVGIAGTGQGYYGVRQGVVWTSTDGSTWQQAVDPALLEVSPFNVVAMGNDVYLFGDYQNCGQDEECSPDANAGQVIFKSSSGGPWQQLAQTPDIIASEFDGVRVWGNTLVAWGAAADDNGTTTVWTSTDGLTWTAATDLAGIDPVDTMAAGGPGLVVVGSEYVQSIDDSQLAAASSTDGTHFSKGTVPAVTGSMMTGSVSGPGGIVAVGDAFDESGNSIGLSLFSTDGATWTQTNASDGSFDNANLISAYTTTGGYVVIGSTVTGQDQDLQIVNVWTSADGKSWRSAGSVGGAYDQYGGSALGQGGLAVFTATQDVNDAGTDMVSTISGWLIPADKLAP